MKVNSALFCVLKWPKSKLFKSRFPYCSCLALRCIQVTTLMLKGDLNIQTVMLQITLFIYC